jgi:hypothetical protein
VNLDGSHNHPLVRGKVADPPAVSRNGSRIAYVRQRGKDYELWVADTDGARTQRLLRASYIENPRFAPGGRGIWAFVIAGGQERELLVDESGQRRTLPDLADDWSHDGLLLAGMDETRLATIRPDGTHRRVLVNFRLSQQSPTHEFAACDAIRWAPASDRLLAACGKETAD